MTGTCYQKFLKGSCSNFHLLSFMILPIDVSDSSTFSLVIQGPKSNFSYDQNIRLIFPLKKYNSIMSLMTDPLLIHILEKASNMANKLIWNGVRKYTDPKHVRFRLHVPF